MLILLFGFFSFLLDAGVYKLISVVGDTNLTIKDAGEVCEWVNNFASGSFGFDENIYSSIIDGVRFQTAVLYGAADKQILVEVPYDINIVKSVNFRYDDSKLPFFEYSRSIEGYNRAFYYPLISKPYFCEHIYLPINIGSNKLARACVWQVGSEGGECKPIISQSNYVREKYLSKLPMGAVNRGLHKICSYNNQGQNLTDVEKLDRLLLKYSKDVCDGLKGLYCCSSKLKDAYSKEDIFLLNKPLLDICDRYLKFYGYNNKKWFNEEPDNLIFSTKDKNFSEIDGNFDITRPVEISGLKDCLGGCSKLTFIENKKCGGDVCYINSIKCETSTSTSTSTFPLSNFQTFLQKLVKPHDWNNSKVSKFRTFFKELKKEDSENVDLKEFLEPVLTSSSVGQFIWDGLVSGISTLNIKFSNSGRAVNTATQLVKVLFTRTMEQVRDKDNKKKGLFRTRVFFAKRDSFYNDDSITKAVLGNANGMLIYELNNTQGNRVYFVYYEPIATFVPVVKIDEKFKIELLRVLKDNRAPVMKKDYCNELESVYTFKYNSGDAQKIKDKLWNALIYNTPITIALEKVNSGQKEIPQSLLTYYMYTKFCVRGAEQSIDNIASIINNWLGTAYTPKNDLSTFVSDLNKEIKKVKKLTEFLEPNGENTKVIDKLKETKLYSRTIFDKSGQNRDTYLFLRTISLKTDGTSEPVHIEIRKNRDREGYSLKTFGYLVAPEFSTSYLDDFYSFGGILRDSPFTDTATSITSINYRFILNLLLDRKFNDLAVKGDSSTKELNSYIKAYKSGTLIENEDDKKLYNGFFKEYLSEYLYKLNFLKLLVGKNLSRDEKEDLEKLINALGKDPVYAYQFLNYSIPGVSIASPVLFNDSGPKKTKDNDKAWGKSRGSGWGKEALVTGLKVGSALYNAYSVYKTNKDMLEELMRKQDPCWMYKELDEQLGIDSYEGEDTTYETTDDEVHSTQQSYYQMCIERLMAPQDVPPDACAQECTKVVSNQKAYVECMRKCVSGVKGTSSPNIPMSPSASQTTQNPEDRRGTGKEDKKDKGINAGGGLGGSLGGTSGAGGYRGRRGSNRTRIPRTKRLSYTPLGSASRRGGFTVPRYTGGISGGKKAIPSKSHGASVPYVGVPNIYRTRGYFPI